jgi:hypothetical protein
LQDKIIFCRYIACSSPNIIRQIKSRRKRWAGHVLSRGEQRKALVGKSEGKSHLEDQGVMGRWDQNGS